MIDETNDKAYKLLRQIHAKAMQLELHMWAFSSRIARTYCGDGTQEQVRESLNKISNHASEQVERYATEAQRLCELIEEFQKVLQEDND